MSKQTRPIAEYFVRREARFCEPPYSHQVALVDDLPEDLLYRDDATLLGLAALVDAGGAFDEAAYASALAALEIDRSQGGGKKEGDFMVENCPCLLVCCPSKLRK